ncbi:tRNA 2-thiocytidine(32) synthetase TtcA [Marinicella litoralis]|uniref:tRNA-cytidine(32) 2-sulfurtransferase n=1 Tax=Marinicella litoralis TaxID=644220 RepID=A0A4R6XRT0_9GAMM|nr:tRNA 2-thiocytidine(32) synthetase TtcA [Marinicella litoralis]TDR20627.1 tRNA s(2)C-32 sulfurtransferase [Marinicella litoralis]
MQTDNTEFYKLENKLRRQMAKASGDFGLIEAGDRIMVCLSGGKDSYAMLSLLQLIQNKAPFEFDLVAVNLDQKQPGFPEHVLPEYLQQQNIEFQIIEEDTYSIVTEIIPAGKTTCGLCSRLRRGILYRVAEELNCNKIALGHHQDDMVETLFLNMFFGAKLKTMPPKLRSDDGKNVVIRPLAYVREKDLINYAKHKDYPIIPCNLCGSQENLQRQAIKHMLHDWDRIQPGRVDNIAKAMTSITPSHLCDPKLFDFKGLQPSQPFKVVKTS